MGDLRLENVGFVRYAVIIRGGSVRERRLCDLFPAAETIPALPDYNSRL